MREPAKPKFRPRLEQLEEKKVMSATSAAVPADGSSAADLTLTPSGLVPTAQADSITAASTAPAAAAGARNTISARAINTRKGFLVFRITQPNNYDNHMTVPVLHVLAQNPQPVPGQTYNVLSLSVRNGTAQTFTASNDFTVKLANQPNFTPILTGNQTWGPGQWIVIYVLTKKYYPIHNQVSGGFIFRLDGGYSTAVPGPSGIFLRLKYNPATINEALDKIVLKGQGAQGGTGIKFGMPDTAIYEIFNAKADKKDFGGLF